MKLRITLSTLLVLALAAAVLASARAQDNVGSVSGYVYRDPDADGVCSSGTEIGEENIPIQLLNRDNNATINLTSEFDGAYFAGDLSVGNWQVTVNPGTQWRVTSQQTRQVLITEDDTDFEDIDFCIVLTGDGGGQTVLPESGAPIAPSLLLSAAAGLLLLLAGGLIWRNGSEN